MQEMTCILDSIPMSKRTYFVQKQTTYPSGFGRTMPMRLDQPIFWIMKRPVDRFGHKDSFYGTKTKLFRGPYLDRSEAEQKALAYNREFHSKFQTVNKKPRF